GQYNHTCEDCFRASTEPSKLPQVLKMKICLRCNYMVNPSTNQRVVEWEKGIEEVVRDALVLHKSAALRSLEIDRHERDDYLMDLRVGAGCDIMGLKFTQEHTSELRITYGVCNRCSRQYGNYYEAIIQLRGGRRSLSEEELDYAVGAVEKRVAGSGAENAFITRAERIHRGLDFYLGDKSLAKEIARELQHYFGGSYLESFSLVGRKDGKDVYRTTYLVRAPDYRAGDFVSYHNRIFLLEKAGEKSAAIYNLITGKSKTLKERELDKLKVIEGDVVEAVVVSISEKEAQLLDPVSYKTVSVLTPIPLTPGETVRVFRYEGGLYLVPTSYAKK
ncbi:MAG: hypothetical protein KAU14_08675, partial [Thermoplasmata archaeon]|nr:hypothetical protein [Thermoplasmata archaeon]